MANSENIKIPLALFKRIFDLLLCWDLDDYEDLIQDEYYEVILAMRKKRQSLELRDDYSKIINATDEDSRDLARMRYLQRKREIYGDEA